MSFDFLCSVSAQDNLSPMALPTSNIILETDSIYCEFILILNAYKVSAHLNFTGATLIKITKAEKR